MNTKLVLIRNSSAMNAGSGTINIVGKRNEFSQKLDYCRPEILFVSSYPPRECGIATYSQDLVNALNMQFYDSFDCSICALESNSEEHVYKQQPSYILNTDSRNSFIKVAFNINRNVNIKLVVIQHEFGFFASKENDFKVFCESIAQPLVFVFHTVLPNPGEDLIRKVGDMANTAAMIIVMTKDAANILIKDYNIPSTSIRVIPHGTHLVPPIEREKMKVQFHFSGRKVLSTFGLLSSSKSIETTLDALPDVIRKHPDVLFLILGKTHPTVVKNEGEKYRNLLIEKVNTLALSKHVLFINEYLPLQTLLGYLQLSDIYLFTSKDPHQAVSGTFSYAMSCGCPVISTPIPQAKELLNNNGIIIDFGNSQQLTRAINKLLEDKQLREQISYNNFQTMASTVWQNSAIAHALLFQALTNNAFQLNYRLPAINLAHVKKLTTDIGIIQFSKISTPDLATGFTLDDNARAMIAMCMHFEQMQDIEDLKYIRIYLQFIHHCLQKDGSLLNYVNESSEFTQQNFVENLEDSTGRAVWALGYVIHLKAILPIEFSVQAEIILECLMPYLIKIHSTRAMAFIIKGLHLQNSSDNLALLKIFANRLVQMYKHERSIDWFWFENYFTYGNSLLSEAMLCAYLSTGNSTHKMIAKDSFDFLLSKIFIDDKIKVISNKGWHIKDSGDNDQIGGEQPIDVAYTIMALQKFYLAFKNEDYKQKSIIAFNWYLGKNHLQQIVYNPCTGGCYDGVEEGNVNLNQGAESTVSYLLARLTMEKILRLNEHTLAKNSSEIGIDVELIDNY